MELPTACRYFQEALAICQRDDGRLWGIPLDGPMLFVEPGSRQAVANQPDCEGHLAQSRELYMGQFPNQLNVANGVIDWAGVCWTMMSWPLPEDARQRARLMAHELWHRVQDGIGLPASNPANEHLDTLEGRYWLGLEWSALRQALTHDGSARIQAIGDALCFREFRRAQFTSAGAQERALEMHEGLAEYTGVKLSCDCLADAMNHAAEALDKAAQARTFVRSFAYGSGPAYGLLLDASGTDWRSGLTPEHDLGLLLAAAHSISPPEDVAIEAQRRADAYDGASLLASETERQRERDRRAADYLARLVDGPVLMISNVKMSVQFDPGNLFPLGRHGTVYPTVRVTDVWGILTASGGALIGPDWREVIVPAPSDPRARPVSGDGWHLELNKDWTIVLGHRPGDYIIRMLHE